MSLASLRTSRTAATLPSHSPRPPRPRPGLGRVTRAAAGLHSPAELARPAARLLSHGAQTGFARAADRLHRQASQVAGNHSESVRPGFRVTRLIGPLTASPASPGKRPGPGFTLLSRLQSLRLAAAAARLQSPALGPR